MKSTHQKVISDKLISIGMLFNYIFEGIKILSNLKTPEFKQKEIQNEIRHQFRELISNTDLSDQFRYLLRELKASQLEVVLYGNCKEPLQPPPNYKKYMFPEDEILEQKFAALNAEYKFFNNTDVNAKLAFILYFKGFKLMADFIECNNDENNSLPAVHAYKMLVIFGQPKKNSPPFKLIEQHISKQVESDHPLHDAFLHVLPVNEPKIKDISGWRKLIANNKNGIIYFQEAIEIEGKLGNAPATIHEAEGISSQLTYPRYKENPKLALLCRQYKLGEAVFNRCLEIELNRKKTDNIPEIWIDGAATGHRSYHLIKLPIDDPRAYILGHITNCCQSVGGHTEQCVVDGVTLSNNGFYVLVKGNKKSSNPIIDGKVNYIDFKIVGQGYVWLSENGNLTIDTWENLRKQDDSIAVAMLKKLGQEITKQTDALQVTIGTGGKTPREFLTCEVILMPSRPTLDTLYEIPITSDIACVFSENKVFYINKSRNICEDLKLSLEKVGESRSKLNPTVKARPILSYELDKLIAITGCDRFATILKQPEKMREGYKCQDSNDQALVYFDQEKLNKIIESLLINNFKNKLFWSSEREFREIIGVDKIISHTEAKDIDNLLSKPKNQLFWRKLMSEDNAGKYKKFLKEGGRDCILALCKLSQAYALTIENFKVITKVNRVSRIPFFVGELLKLHNAGILNDENRTAIIEANNAYYVCDVADAIIVLHHGGILNNQNRKFIMSNIYGSKEIANALVIMNDAGIMNDKVRHIITDLIGSLDKLDIYKLVIFARALVTLYMADLATDENINCIIPKNEVYHASALARTLVLLHKANPENTEYTKTASKYANRISANVVKALDILDKLNIFDENILKTIMNSESIYSLCSMIVTLDENKMLTKSNLDAAIKFNSTDLSDTMSILSNVKLLGNENFQLLLDIIPHQKVDIMFFAREMLNFEILNKDSFGLLISNLNYADQLQDAIERLIRQHIFNNITFKDIMGHPEHALDIVEAWGILQKADMLNDKNRKILLHANLTNIVNLAKAFVTLHKADMFTSINRKIVLQNCTQASVMAEEIVFKSKWKDILADEIQNHLRTLKDISSQSAGFGLFKFGFSNKEIFDAGMALINLLKGNINGKFDKEKYLPILCDGALGILLDNFVKIKKPEKIQSIPALIDYACATVYVLHDLPPASRGSKSHT